MTIADTSRDAYHTTEDKRRTMQDRIIFLYRTAGDKTDLDMAKLLGWRPSDVSARRDGADDMLRESGTGERIIITGKVRHPDTEKTVRVYGLRKVLKHQIFELGEKDDH